MPYNIPSQYAAGTSIGDTIAGLGNSLFGKGGLEAEVLRQKATSSRRENENVPLLADAIASGNNDAAIRAGVLAGIDPKNVAGYGQFRAVNQYGPRSTEALTATMAVPGANYGNTVQGTEAEMGNKRAIAGIQADKTMQTELLKQDAQPINVIDPATGKVTVMARHAAIRAGATPVLSAADAQGAFRQQGFASGYAGFNPAQQAAAGVEPKNPGQMYVYKAPDGRTGTTMDGKTDVQTGQPLPPGTPVARLDVANVDGLSGNSTVDQQIFHTRTATQQAVANIDRLVAGLSQPGAAASVGYLGTLARGFNDLRAQTEATLGLVGGSKFADAMKDPEVSTAVNFATQTMFGDPRINARAQQLGVDSSILRSQIMDLAYTIAKAQDPGGRVSVDDIRRASEVVGSSIMDPTAAVAVLGDLKSRMIQGQQIRESVAKQMYPGLRTDAPPAAAPAAPQAPAAQQPAAAPRTRIDINGNPIQ